MTGEAAFAIRAFLPADAEAVIALWRECGLVRAVVGFYRKLGYGGENVKVIGKRLIADH